MLLRSDVPEGKGVSSSAAVEVAAMSAIAAAYQMEIAPRSWPFVPDDRKSRSGRAMRRYGPDEFGLR
ncbi:MAG: hypothetical protein R2911_18975 [Caldilineaceae bacterium]